jgi:hypothetical protein
LQLDANEDAFWVNRKKHTRSSQVTVARKDLIVDWWTTQSTISLNTKDIVRNRVVVNMWAKHPVHYLQVLQVRYEVTIPFSR